jgi:hypothetical protein
MMPFVAFYKNKICQAVNDYKSIDEAVSAANDYNQGAGPNEMAVFAIAGSRDDLQTDKAFQVGGSIAGGDGVTIDTD